MSTYMTRAQFDRHREATAVCKEKLDIARKKVGKAAEHGDLSENAEYEAAIEESGFLAGRLEELRFAMAGCTVIDPRNTDPDHVSIGKTVNVRDVASGDENTYHIVGVGTTQTDKGEVSYQAPLGGGLIGSTVGQTVSIDLPAGEKQFEIVSIAIYDE